ncbi:hypothetical protein GCM10022286_10160 [Gryllotalpicola daejeonensis]|uniref:HTH cro/C1-type domain-containing protein n=1 Tax=Gryllotalpicola daejeonensis TaxID=993087 RepID=A0ABP7ZH95_9MICO
MPEPISSAAEAFGRKLQNERKELGASQRQIAEEAEIDEASYRKIELGYRNPNLHNMLRIAGALGVPLAKLVDGIDESMTPPAKERTAPREPLDELKKRRDAKRSGR